jgi:hypothetical protein
MEVTFEDTRAHLEMEMQRQWNTRTIGRTTPALLALSSMITLTAYLLPQEGAPCVRSTAWYRKTRPTFSNAIALVRRHIWDHLYFSMSQRDTNLFQMPRILLERLTEALCYAAQLHKVELAIYCE